MNTVKAVALAGVVIILGAYMTNTLAVKFAYDAGRFMVDGQRLGGKTIDVLALASAKYAKEAQCSIKKAGLAVIKKAKTEKVCVFSSLEGVVLAGQKVLEVQYKFIDGHFEQLDLEIEEVTVDSKDALLQELTTSLNVDLEVEGPMNRWSGQNDVAMLIRQGNYKFRMTNRLYLPKDSDYNRLTSRK